MLKMKDGKAFYLLIILAFALSGCASVRHAIPPDLLSSARVFGMQDIRAFSGIPSDSFKKDFVKLLEEEDNFETGRTYYMLAISEGGDYGAYGAGLLCGWTESGTRPVFKVVTGVSTGALMAPFAFLGSKYDAKLKEIYTKYSTKDIVRIRLPFINSFTSTLPLERLIERYFDIELLKEIATEHKKGRRLYIGTTNLDAERLVIWDMGKIATVASAGDDKALKLFRKIMLASASVPVAFPPVYLNVEANDKRYDEMHVDGGVTRQVFFLYDVLEGFDKALKEKGIDISRIKYAIYVIKNGYIEPLYKEIPDNFLAIAKRTVDTMMKEQSIGDLYQLYVFAKEHNAEFNLAFIPATHVFEPKELLKPFKRQELFNLGFEEAVRGYDWKKTPPGIKKE